MRTGQTGQGALVLEGAQGDYSDSMSVFLLYVRFILVGWLLYGPPCQDLPIANSD